MIKAAGLRKVYEGKAVVSEVSFELPKGSVLVLLGSSGSGKTTLLKMLNRLIEPDGGRFWLDGQAADQYNPASLRRKIGYVIQQIGLFPHQTVAENIGTVPSLLGWSKSAKQARTEELLDLLGLPFGEYGNRYPAELSGGQQQRIGIARALAAKPDVLLMDEPFGALDPLIRAAVQEEFKQLQQRLKLTVILVTHDVPEAFLLADQLILMDQGRVMQQGKPEELLFMPQNEFVRRFFDPQRLQLELSVPTIAALGHHLPPTEKVPDEGIPAFHESDTLLPILEQANRADSGSIVLNWDSKAPSQHSTAELLAAFNLWKAALPTSQSPQ